MQSLTHHARTRMQQRGIRPEAIIITVGHRYRRVTRA